MNPHTSFLPGIRDYQPRLLPIIRFNLRVAGGVSIARFAPITNRVMAGLVPAIHVFEFVAASRHGCPAQGRA
jgi:hypothetical protein